MHELQALGVALVGLPETQLRSMALADDLLEAVLEAKRIKSHEARRRQMQYIGRLMRDIDPGAIRSRLGERSEERRVGKECRSGGGRDPCRKKRERQEDGEIVELE